MNQNTHTKLWSAENTTSKTPYNRKLRILWLSNPKQGLNQAKLALENSNTLPVVLWVVSNKARAILWNTDNPVSEIFESSTLLVRDDDMLSSLLEENGLHIEVDDIFNFERDWYSFSHTFIQSESESYDGLNNYDEELPLMSCLKINGKAIDETMEILGEAWFKRLEKSLWALMAYTNHDYTMHRFWIVLEQDSGGIDTSLNERIQWNIPWGNSELTAAIFHRDLLDEMQESGIDIYSSIQHQASVFLGEINKIPNLELQKFWITLLKYPLFSLVNPEDNSTDSWKIIESLKTDFPKLNLDPTRWGKAIHRENATLLLWGSTTEVNIPIRNLRKIVHTWLQEADPEIEKKLVRYIAESQWWQGVHKTWNDLDKLSLVEQGGVNSRTSDEVLDQIIAYFSAKKVLFEVLAQYQVNSWHILYRNDIEQIYDNVMRHQNTEYFDVDDTTKISEMLTQWYENDASSIILSLNEEDLIASYVHNAIRLQNVYFEASQRWCNLWTTIQRDWYKKNNEEIMRRLIELEEKVIDDDSLEYFEDQLWRVVERNKKNHKWERFQLERFENYDMRPLIEKVESRLAA